MTFRWCIALGRAQASGMAHDELRAFRVFKPFFALDVPRVRASNAALDGRKSRTGRRSSGIRHRSLRAIHTTHCHSRSIALNTLRGSANTISYIFGPASPIRSVTMRASASKRQ